MIKILEGQITFGGMQDALEAVARHKNIKHGVVQVTSNSCSGLMGVFCGQYITGALLTLSGESGLPALKSLLSAKDGSFAFLDVTNEPIPDLNQSLGVDLQSLLTSDDLSLDEVQISHDSLASIGSSGDSIKLIDTAHEEEAPPANLTAQRANATYTRISTVSSHLKPQMPLPPRVANEHSAPTEAVESLKEEESWAETTSGHAFEAPPAPPLQEGTFYESPEDYERMRRKEPGVPQAVDISSQFVGLAADEDFASPPPAPPDNEIYKSLEAPVQGLNKAREEKHTATGNYAVIYDAAPPTDSKQKSTNEFKRLKDWKVKRRIMIVAGWTVVVLGAIGIGVWQYMQGQNQKPIPTVDELPKVEPVKQEPLHTLPRGHRHHHR